MRQTIILALALALGALPATAQDAITDVSKLADAAKSLPGMAKDRLLIADLLGKQISGSNGSTIGTVENFVVIPGGRIVAAIVKTQDGTTIALPLSAVKLAPGKSGGQMIQATLPASQITGMPELKSLAGSLTN